jgi:hypothetical protein
MTPLRSKSAAAQVGAWIGQLATASSTNPATVVESITSLVMRALSGSPAAAPMARPQVEHNAPNGPQSPEMGQETQRLRDCPDHVALASDSGRTGGPVDI